MSFLRISKSSGLEILPSPFLSMALTNWVTSSFLTSRLRPRLLKASLMREKISLPSRVPDLSVSYLLKMESIACRSWSSLGLELIPIQYKQIMLNPNQLLYIPVCNARPQPEEPSPPFQSKHRLVGKVSFLVRSASAASLPLRMSLQAAMVKFEFEYGFVSDAYSSSGRSRFDLLGRPSPPVLDLAVVFEGGVRTVLLLAVDTLGYSNRYDVVSHQFFELPAVLLLLARLLREGRVVLEFDESEGLDPALEIGDPAVEFGEEVEVLQAAEVALGELERVHFGFWHRGGSTFESGASEIFRLTFVSGWTTAVVCQHDESENLALGEGLLALLDLAVQIAHLFKNYKSIKINKYYYFASKGLYCSRDEIGGTLGGLRSICLSAVEKEQHRLEERPGKGKEVRKLRQ